MAARFDTQPSGFLLGGNSAGKSFLGRFRNVDSQALGVFQEPSINRDVGYGTLRQNVEELGLLRSPADALELAIRPRLRDALADHGAGAHRVARLLGMSVRALQRRLASSGRTWSDVVEA